MNSDNHRKTLTRIKRFYFFLFSFIFVISQVFLNVYAVNYFEELLIKQRLEQNQQMVEMAFDALKKAPMASKDYEEIVPFLREMTARKYFNSESFVCAIDSDGYIIAHPDPKRVGLYRGNEQIQTASGSRPFAGETYLVEGIWDNRQFSRIEIVSTLYDEQTKITIAAHQNKSLVDKHLSIVRLYFALFSVLILGALFIIGWLLSRSVVGKYVHQIEQYENELDGFNTELEKRVEERTMELASTNNQLLREIETRKHAEEALQTARNGLEISVQERTAELSQANALLANKNEELETFAYSVSHDLRAPLRSIDGFSHALLEDCTDSLDEHGKDYLNRVRAASQRMGQLIDDMLHLARVSKKEMIRQDVDLSSIAKSIAKELQAKQPERKVTFLIASEAKVTGDAHLLHIVLENLLDNAWKYSSKHSHAQIEFGVAEQEAEKVYFVRDDGAGFDAKFAGKLFRPFERIHGSNEFEGNGIGLATVQRIIHRHGGRLWAEGVVEEGATFYFTLPYNRGNA